MIFQLLGIDEMLSHSIVTHTLSKAFCDPTHVQKEICTNLLFLLFGFDKKQFNTVSNSIFRNENTFPIGVLIVFHLCGHIVSFNAHFFTDLDTYDYK